MTFLTNKKPYSIFRSIGLAVLFSLYDEQKVVLLLKLEIIKITKFSLENLFEHFSREKMVLTFSSTKRDFPVLPEEFHFSQKEQDVL